ncbi:MAG: site-specific tyrosine recombinase XerD [Actinobacteria bacterium]|nr:site-specific tyrosine recombinase XerD [Actinomycetota bacterium]
MVNKVNFENLSIERNIKNFIDYIRFERQLASNTIFSYKRDLNKYKLFLSLQKVDNYLDVSYDQILSFLEYLNENYCGSSISRMLSSSRNFYKFLVREKIVKKNPFIQIKNPKKPKKILEVLSENEVNRFLNRIPYSTKLEIRDRAMFELLYSSGLRVSEIVNLKISNIDFDEGLIRFIGKGEKERITPVGETSKLFLKKYLNIARFNIEKEIKSDYVFLNKNGKKLTRQGFWKILKKYDKKINLGKNLYPHIFRHSFATHMIERGADLRVVQELLGHSDISTTEIYTNLNRKYIKDIYFKYHPREKNSS